MSGICNLCKKREANKPNSHIISNFLVAPMYGYRDKAESFVIESNEIPLSIINEEGTDNVEEREQQNNKGKENMEDNILCSICEKRLGDFLEGNFSQEFNFNSQNINSINTNQYQFDYFNFQNANVVLFHLTMYSLFWRVHISKTKVFRDFSLSSEISEKLRKMIDTILPEYTPHSRDFTAQPLEKLKNWLKDIKDTNVKINELMHIYNYIVLYRNGFNNESENEAEHSGNGINTAFKIHETAYLFFFGVYIIIFFEGDITTFKHNFFDIPNKYDLNKLSNKNDDRNIKIGILDEVFYQKLMNEIRESYKRIISLQKE